VKNDFTNKLENSLKEERLPFRYSKEEAKINVMKRVDLDAPVIELSSYRPSQLIAIAAAAVVILFIAIWGYSDYRHIRHQEASVIKHELPDGSEVYLRSGSDLSYHTWEWTLNRRVLDFDGIGYFKVEEGNVFTVETPRGEVSVLGTSFSVVTGANRLKVSCETGKVLVRDDKGFEKILTPGQGIEMSDSEIELVSVVADDIDGWIEGRYDFDGDNISRVLNVVEDLTGMDVKYEADPDLEFSGSISEDQSIEDLLDIVCKPLGLSYDVDKSNQIIRIK